MFAYRHSNIYRLFAIGFVEGLMYGISKENNFAALMVFGLIAA